ncbi:P-loop containing nucleoside triphosphate hydrolase protein [Suillus clintonianus]|uniref:P-loop containing nucleoside triphosphate hydrolase protein n=1 Tax=Suillus clintonianus TaxID=1904413 RepID=UPI001B885B1A|nr:P-loop containing nucleoside triphosphate hydrolase protein [Suillus clintonianus]KAG2112529.1 P-loop containing nucleoside triphosphate hydrolase protein [Suillus clintonianus]
MAPAKPSKTIAATGKDLRSFFGGAGIIRCCIRLCTTPTGRILNLFSRDTCCRSNPGASDPKYGTHERGLRFYRIGHRVQLPALLDRRRSAGVVLLQGYRVRMDFFFFQNHPDTIDRYYLSTSRELKRLDAVSRSPIFAWFSESLAGISTIRAFDQQSVFIASNARRIDRNQLCYLPSTSVNRWLAVRLEFVGAIIIFVTDVLTVAAVATSDVDAGLVGLVLSWLYFRLEVLLTKRPQNWFSSLSAGQRQLLCFARAFLRKTKVLVLDEATSAVDLDSDRAIQEIIRGPIFRDVTILTIAHRLNTIMESDRVLVLDAGRIAKFESPQKLLENKSSIFRSMAMEAGLVQARPDDEVKA